MRFRPALAAALLAWACMVEDRGVAQDVTTLFDMLEIRDVLECVRGLQGGYPSSLQEIASATVAQKCPRSESLTQALARLQGGTFHRQGHAWRYSAADQDANGRFKKYVLSAADIRGRDHYRSFWVDERGVVRSAKGREAGPDDTPESLQKAPR